MTEWHKMIKLCKNCKKEFKTFSERKVFCCKECNIDFNNKKQIEKKCPVCGKLFIKKKHKNAIYCSRKCSSKSFYKIKTVKECKFCGKKMILEPCNKNKIYCSSKCYRKDGKKHDRKCCVCGIKYTGSKYSNFCSKKCRKNYKCPICNNKINNTVSMRGNKYCSKKCFKEANSRLTKKMWEIQPEKYGMPKGHKMSKKTREKMSLSQADRIIDGKIYKYYRNGFFYSEKNKKNVIYRSSYEKFYFNILESDKSVLSYEVEPFRIPYFYNNMNKNYIPDILIHYKNDTLALVEIKSIRRLNEFEAEQIKIIAGKEYCKNKKLDYKLLTENELKTMNPILWDKIVLKRKYLQDNK